MGLGGGSTCPAPPPAQRRDGGPAAAPVGGIAELPDIAQDSAGNSQLPADASDSQVYDYLALGTVVAVGLLALTAGAWYARKRWGR